MAKSTEQLLIDIEHNQQLVEYYSTKVRRLLREFCEQQGPVPVPWSSHAQSLKGKVKSLAIWAEWLAENGPATKQTITEATGTRLSDNAKPRMLQWSRLVPANDDDAQPPDKVCYISDKPSGRGRPQNIYFLWSQRFDVHPKFGVGPVKPEDEGLLLKIPDEFSEPDPQAGDEFVAEIERLITEPVDGAATVGTDAVSEPEPTDPVHYLTLEGWNNAHEAFFDALVASEGKPSDAQKEFLLSTMPLGVDGASAIAMAYQSAVLRARNQKTVLGVIQPPADEQPAKPWEDMEFDWDAAERGMSDDG